MGGGRGKTDEEVEIRPVGRRKNTEGQIETGKSRGRGPTALDFLERRFSYGGIGLGVVFRKGYRRELVMNPSFSLYLFIFTS